MKIFLNILAILLVVVGVFWFLQGINVLPGSVMTGQTQWAIIGAIAFVIGIIVFIFANRKKSSPPKSSA
jgi:uncharacterized membrane protein HdeD (DUF308 family)